MGKGCVITAQLHLIRLQVMSKRRDYPIVFARLPVGRIKAEHRAVLAQVREAERRGKSPIKDQVSFLISLVDRFGWRVCGSSPTEYSRWRELTKLES